MHLSVKNVSSGYGRLRVLHEVSIEVENGGSVGLFGPNGHGKTTLLRTISGLLSVEHGEIEFNGKKIGNAAAHQVVEAGLIHVPQGSTILPRMTVLEALTLGAFPKHAWAQRKLKLEEVFSIFPRLAERRQQNCNTLSGGERQMAAIGVGLMSCPKLLMLDEPTLGLAPRIREELGEQIAKVAESGVTLIVVDQDVDLLLKLCPRLYLIEQGKVALEIKDRSEITHQDVINRYFGSAA
ncbi:ABC transporter ATP-binding protein [Hoeflea sp.]|uniref:ABC transporter ATP-binding protein n=1 Tax=Hoeflea sp. TaxID=1940281 RepID=UPI003B51B412